MSRRTRKAVIVLCLVIASLLAYFDKNLLKHPGRSSSTATAEQRRAGDIAKYHDKIFTVVYVVDGDTLDINIPDNRDNRTRIRLWGVDTPETKSEEFGVMYFGPQAYEFTKKSALNKHVHIYLDQQRDTRDKYDRLLAYVQLPDGSFLNEILLSEGFAYADLRFRHDFYNKYKQLESAARSDKKGLWKNVTFEQMPKWRQERLSEN
jgi:endonuclease YncB( thermonuclease family)